MITHRPRIAPLSRLTGATPAKAAIRLRSSRPSSGSSAISVRAGPRSLAMPGCRGLCRRGPGRCHGARAAARQDGVREFETSLEPWLVGLSLTVGGSTSTRVNQAKLSTIIGISSQSSPRADEARPALDLVGVRPDHRSSASRRLGVSGWNRGGEDRPATGFARTQVVPPARHGPSPWRSTAAPGRRRSVRHRLGRAARPAAPPAQRPARPRPRSGRRAGR